MNEPGVEVMALVEQCIENARRLGIPWTEAVEAFGLAARALGDYAAKEEAGSEQRCLLLARMNLELGFDRVVATNATYSGSYACH